MNLKIFGILSTSALFAASAFAANSPEECSRLLAQARSLPPALQKVVQDLVPLTAGVSAGPVLQVSVFAPEDDLNEDGHPYTVDGSISISVSKAGKSSRTFFFPSSSQIETHDGTVTLVATGRHGSGYFRYSRPQKGLLAGLWEAIAESARQEWDDSAGDLSPRVKSPRDGMYKVELTYSLSGTQVNTFKITEYRAERVIGFPIWKKVSSASY